MTLIYSRPGSPDSRILPVGKVDSAFMSLLHSGAVTTCLPPVRRQSFQRISMSKGSTRPNSMVGPDGRGARRPGRSWASPLQTRGEEIKRRRAAVRLHRPADCLLFPWDWPWRRTDRCTRIAQAASAGTSVISHARNCDGAAGFRTPVESPEEPAAVLNAVPHTSHPFGLAIR